MQTRYRQQDTERSGAGVSVISQSVTSLGFGALASLSTSRNTLTFNLLVVDIVTGLSVLALAVFLVVLIVLEVRASQARRRLTPLATDGSQPQIAGDITYRWPDEAIGQNDPLGVSKFVKVIGQQILLAENTSYAIAIDAEWGMGKTTAMTLLRQWLDKNGCLTIWFNAWKYRHADTQRALMNSLFSGIPPETWDEYLRTSRRRLRLIEKTGNMLGRLVRLGQLGRVIADALNDESPYRLQLEDDFATIIATWTKQDRLHRHPLVVIFVDDLDRCAPTEMASVLETMKLFFEQPGCIFVFGYDAFAVAAGIQQDYHGVVRDGLTYLKKVVQVSYQLPSPDDAALRRYVDEAIKKRNLGKVFTEVEKLTDYHSLIIEGTMRNLRDIKRFLDALVIGYQMVDQPLVGEHSYLALCMLVMLQVRWPHCYRDIVRATQRGGLQLLVDQIYQDIEPLSTTSPN